MDPIQGNLSLKEVPRVFKLGVSSNYEEKIGATAQKSLLIDILPYFTESNTIIIYYRPD